MPTSDERQPLAVVGGRLCTGLADVTSDLTALDSAGFWAVVIPYSGAPVCARFDHVVPARLWRGPAWVGPRPDQWRSSLDERSFGRGVDAIRECIAAGGVYQVVLFCLVLSSELNVQDCVVFTFFCSKRSFVWLAEQNE